MDGLWWKIPIENGWFGGTFILGNLHIFSDFPVIRVLLLREAILSINIHIIVGWPWEKKNSHQEDLHPLGESPREEFLEVPPRPQRLHCHRALLYLCGEKGTVSCSCVFFLALSKGDLVFQFPHISSLLGWVPYINWDNDSHIFFPSECCSSW